MPIIYRPKRPSSLYPDLLKEKQRRDTEYELSVQELYRTLPRDQAQAKKTILWRVYEDWAKQAGLYEEVSIQQQIDEAQETLNTQLEDVNLLRAEAGISPPLRIVP